MPDYSNRKPKLSVIMPVRNGGPYLDVAVESILDQTFSDFEFIVIDDHSTDDTWAKLQNWAVRDGRIRPSIAEYRGISSALNQAIGLAQADFVARMDADDVSLATRFEKQLDCMEHNQGIGVLGTQAGLINSLGHTTGRVLYPISAEDCDAYCLIGVPFAHGSVMMRRSVLDAVGGYRSQHDKMEDLDLWLRLRKLTTLANLSEELFQIRVHPQNSSRVWNERDLVRILERRLEIYKFAITTNSQTVDELIEVQGAEPLQQFIRFHAWAYTTLMGMDRKELDGLFDALFAQALRGDFALDRRLIAFIFVRQIELLRKRGRYGRVMNLLGNIGTRMPVDIIREVLQSFASGSNRKWHKYDLRLLHGIELP